MLPRRIMTILWRLPAGIGALYGDRDASPKGLGLAEEEARGELVVGVDLALMLPLLDFEASR